MVCCTLGTSGDFATEDQIPPHEVERCFQECISKTHSHANFCVTEPFLASGVAIADGYSSRDRLSPEIYEESETDPGAEDVSTRIFVALFDYDPLTMSPNPDAAEEELPFKEGQIIKVGCTHGMEPCFCGFRT